MDRPSYRYDEANTRVVLEDTEEPVAICVPREHGILLASAPLFKVACEKIEEILRMDHLSHEQRVHAGQELLGLLLNSYQREQIRDLPEVA